MGRCFISSFINNGDSVAFCHLSKITGWEAAPLPPLSAPWAVSTFGTDEEPPRRCVGAVPPLPSAGGGWEARVSSQPQRAPPRGGGSRNGVAMRNGLRAAVSRRRLGRGALPRSHPRPLLPSATAVGRSRAAGRANRRGCC